MPDLYVYEFNNAQITDKIDLNLTDDELGNFFSDYMMEKKDDFNLIAEYREREQKLFSTGEQISMENARNLLNDSLFALAGFGILTVLGYAVYLLKKRKMALRFAFQGAAIFYAVLCVLTIIAFNLVPVRTALQQFIFIYPHEADDVLPFILTGKFARDCISAGTLGAGIIMGILASFTWKITKPRRMFW
jgi:hypothetical protein